MAEKVIFHCDCNGYYASVELLQRSELANLPVAVSGSKDARHGIILAKNEAAKSYNVKTAETIWQARQKCPNLILLPPHREEYTKYHNIINNIYSEYSDLVEPFGIDESWLDMSGSWQLFGQSPKEVADIIRNRVEKETNLTISVGVSFNKVFAKLASDIQKPDATTLIMKEDFKNSIWPMDASALLYVGKRVRELLKGLGIDTIGQLAQADKELLHMVLGKQGLQLWQYANGLDNSPVLRYGESEPAKSIGNGLTFKRDLKGYQDISTGVAYLADEVAVRLRKKNLYACSLQVLIKNTELKNITRQKQLNYPTNLAKDIVINAMALIQEHWDMNLPIRMLTLTAQQLTNMPVTTQLSFFEVEEHQSHKQEKLEKSMDKIKNKYGKSAIMQAAALHNDIGIEFEAKPKKEEK